MSLSKARIKELLDTDPRAREAAADILAYVRPDSGPQPGEPTNSIRLFEAEFGTLPRGTNL